jgi:8-oxo-dGTP pyrophosphatase MutT (NUDIX family)
MKREPEPRPDAVVDDVPDAATGWPVRSYHAAGGVVVHDGSVLLLRRRDPSSGPDEVRLPKGHAEPDESAAECAVREVQEEAGLRAPTIAAPLGTVENRFAYGGERFVRYETWFLMTVDDPAMLDPEPQFEPVWHPLAQAERALSYEAERLAFRWSLRHCAVLGPV